jgi:microcystin-dependent protein
MSIIDPLPNNIVNGDPIDATPVMANFDQVVANVNSNAADLNAINTFSQPQNGVAALLPAQLVTLQQLQGLLALAVPTGTMLDFAGGAAPSGYLLCDGSAVSRTTYALLFGAIATAWGAGDGVTTFNVPDMRRAASIGSGGAGTGVIGNTVGSAGGAETHVISGSELPTHNHGVSDPTHNHGVSDPGHAHGVSDPGHAHLINDPGHGHSYTAPGSGTVSGGVTFFGGGTQAAATASSGTGIGIFAALTNIGIALNGTNISLSTASTGITIQNAGSSAAMSLMQPSRVVTKIIRTGL